jgi:hypothetical protein
VGNPIPMSNNNGQMIQLPPMIKTPKDGRQGGHAIDRNNHNFMMHTTQNLTS